MFSLILRSPLPSTPALAAPTPQAAWKHNTAAGIALQGREAPTAPPVQAGMQAAGEGCCVPDSWPPAKLHTSSWRGRGPITLLSLEWWKEALIGSGWAPAEAGDPLGRRSPPVM